MSGGFTEDHERASAATRQRSNADDERRKAALYVASRATDAADCTHLLQALGLLQPGFRWRTDRPHGPRKKVTE